MTIGEPRPANRRLPVAVLSNQHLMSEAVRMALMSRGFVADSLRTPESGAQLREVARRISAMRPGVGVIMCEIDDPKLLRHAVALIEAVDIHWVLLTGSRDEAKWGAALAAGGDAVLPMSTSLDDLSAVLSLVASGRPAMAVSAKARMIRAWQELGRLQRDLTERFDVLTPREVAILEELSEGRPVGVIAESSGVAVGTVRSQVKSILRKLHVSSQLAAVAAYRQVIANAPQRRLRRH